MVSCSCESFLENETLVKLPKLLAASAKQNEAMLGSAGIPLTIPVALVGQTMIFVAGKSRSLTEISAAANAIVAATNCEDLAAGVADLNRMIAEQRRELQRLRSGVTPPQVLNVALHLPPGAVTSDPERLTELWTKALQDALRTGTA
jgi:hypothetical protein